MVSFDVMLDFNVQRYMFFFNILLFFEGVLIKFFSVILLGFILGIFYLWD